MSTLPADALIPKDRYTSLEYLEAERSRLWPHVWLAAGLASDAPEAGCYFTFETGAESLLIVRQTRGFRTFHNVCLHRGRRLREPGAGRAQAFRCPFHGWEWGCDGALLRVPDRETFPGGVPDAGFGLAEVRCTTWAGLVWVCLDPKAPELAEYLGPAAPAIEAYDLEQYALVEDQTVDLPCNWKAAVDAFNENYHLKTVHGAILDVLDDVNVRADLLGRHSRLVVPFFVPSPRRENREQITDTLRWFLEEAGLPRDQMTGSALDMRRAVQKAIRDRERAGEIDCSKLADDQLTDNHHFYVFPNLQLDIYALKLMILRHRPHPTDPGRMLFDQLRFERVTRSKPRPPRPKHEQFVWGAGSLGTVTDQDTFNLVRQQQGMQSTGFVGLKLGEQEICIRHMHQVLDSYLNADASQYDTSRQVLQTSIPVAPLGPFP